MRYKLSNQANNRVPPPAPARIRILHSIGHLQRGGIEMWLYQMVKRLDSNCFEHHVMVRTDKEEAFTQEFKTAGAQVLPCVNYTNPPKYTLNFSSLVKKHGPYDILHVHGSNPNGVQAGVLARLLGIKRTIVHCHNDLRPLLQHKSALYRTYIGLTMGLLRVVADRGLAVSALAAESMFGLNWRNDSRFQLLFCGVDFAPFFDPPALNLRNKLGIPVDALVIGHVGRFHEQKNHGFIVEIAREAIQKDPKSHFLFIGDGALRNQIQSEFQRDILAGHATFIPDTRSIAPYMSIMNCFVFPSRYEGLGLVAVEAQAAGLPCLISDRVPAEAILDPSLVKVLTLEDSPRLWADAILRSKNHSTVSTQAHREFLNQSRFNLDRNASDLAALYRATLINA